MAVQSHNGRTDRFEHVLQIIAEGQISLRKLIADLATATSRGLDQVAEQSRETEARFRETDARIDKLAHEGAERSRRADERVDKLVLAIGELIRRLDSPRQ